MNRPISFMQSFKNYLHKHAVIISFGVGLIITVGLLTYLILNFIWINGSVHGKSMQPNFYNGDRVIVSPHSPVQRGDIVVVDPPGTTQNKFFLKRVIGLPNETISSKDDTTYINDHSIDEPYLDPYKARLAPNQLLTKNYNLKALFGIHKIPANKYFVMGDNRRQSADSRTFGPVAKNRIIGVVKVRYWPLNRFKIY
ncbi:signal peptidase I [Bombilactobacillus thymidiniphilus]|uniref:Signal peptidase I n=1 Tax=Bombilactobacillus thymidiniphilus TaxID=2923363 RepID=A0ABY4PEN1_9LACO|nr:signal peptidase I [Bombilactobacillus thymidiniphilus]UQS83964.1 signal peptidase I [Bombilactobacillus thymidiniphilus]